jgi:hypothetical protein
MGSSSKAISSEETGTLGAVLTLTWAIFFLLAAGWLVWLCCSNPKVSFLCEHRPAHWIVDSQPVSARVRPTEQLATTFRHTLRLGHSPSSATLSLRAFKACTLSVNGNPVALPAPSANWKTSREFDVASLLKAGNNTLDVTVSNNIAPSALWFSLTAPGLNLNSDESWEVTDASGSVRPARIATRPPLTAPGDLLAGQEQTRGSLAKSWPLLGVFASLGAVITLGAHFWLRKAPSLSFREPSAIHAISQWCRDPALMLFAAIVALWACLLAHNIGLVPRGAGFDAYGHLEYIEYIQDHAALPLADQGWEMHQPPLYYLACAAILNSLGLSVVNEDGLRLLRWISMAVCLIHTALILGMLRLLFPNQAAKQVVGLAVAGFVPMQLYLAHYPTNEPLAGCLMAATAYLVLRLLCTDNFTFRACAAVGIYLGLALLTKVTALVLVPVVLTALIYGAWKSKISGLRPWLFPLVSAALCLAVCGWHFWRVWRHFGTAFFPETHFVYSISWWQDPGYRTSAYFLGFGRSLSNPFFSGISSFTDGLYSTLWGDGLCGGAGVLRERPPWNYGLMTAGFILALVPSLLMAAGFIARLWRLIYRPEPGWLILAAFCLTTLLAMLYLNLMVPTYAVAKSFYGLGILGALCVLAATGWDVLVAKSKPLRVVTGIALTTWALAAYASFWCNS